MFEHVKYLSAKLGRSGVDLEIRKSLVVDCCVACMVFFADEYFTPAVTCE